MKNRCNRNRATFPTLYAYYINHFRYTGDLGQLLRGVMAEAKLMTSAERCSLFLIDEYTGELVSKVFDGDEVVYSLPKCGLSLCNSNIHAGNIRDTHRTG